VPLYGENPRSIICVRENTIHNRCVSSNSTIDRKRQHPYISVFRPIRFVKGTGQKDILSSLKRFLCPRHSKNGGGALSVTPVRASVRPSVIKIWCPPNNFWKTASIQFKFGMFIYHIKTQVKFDLGYNPLIFDGVMGLL